MSKNANVRNKYIWKLSAICLSLVAVMLFISACGRFGGETASNEKKVVSVVLKTQSSEFWGYVEVGCRAYAKEHPDTIVEIKGASSEAAFDEQRAIVETDLESGRYHAMVLAPLNSRESSEIVDKADIPVIALDTIVTSDKVSGFAGMNNKAAARDGAEAAVKAAKAKGWEDISCVEIAGTEDESTNERRRAGFKEGVIRAGGTFYDKPLIYAHSSRDEAAEAMEKIMEKYPEGVSIIAAHNDDCAMAALETAMGNEAYEDTIFIGFDGNGMACQTMKDDPAYENYMTVGQNPYDMGYRAVEAAVKAADGSEIKGKRASWTGNAPLIDTGWTLIDHKTVDDRLYSIRKNWDNGFKPAKIYKGSDYE